MSDRIGFVRDVMSERGLMDVGAVLPGPGVEAAGLPSDYDVRLEAARLAVQVRNADVNVGFLAVAIHKFLMGGNDV